jgi:hypothetical protein
MTGRFPRAALCIWTDVDPQHEADFNQWYDREHMQERVSIAGFQCARRFKRLDGGERPYLALYTTRNLGVFRADQYQHAFKHQTEWSQRNFGRMRDTQRRVGELRVERGNGEGSALSLFILPEKKVDNGRIASMLDEAVVGRELTSATMLVTDPALSVSLTAKAALLPPADAVVMVEGPNSEATRRAAIALARAFDVAVVRTFGLLWRLAANDQKEEPL